MKAFSYMKPADAETAVRMLTTTTNAKFLGGGTNLVDLMRENIERPDTLIDVTGLPFDRIEARQDGGIRIGATVRNTDVAGHAAIRERFPVLSQAVLFGASGQLRNMATVGGNLMQRTRCLYFYDEAARCNKREPGAGCDALQGFNRMHAILGASEHCIATHPSDMCVALAALDATVTVVGPAGERQIAFADFHRLPEASPHIDTNLQSDELITAVDIPALGFAGHSLYRKVRDRASYAFALVSVAAALELQNGKVSQVRIALGGVAHKPWRAHEAERFLVGAPAEEASYIHAAELETAAAHGLAYNGFKIELVKRAIVSVLKELSASPMKGQS